MRVRDDLCAVRAARWLVRQHLARAASRPIPAALAPQDLAQAYAVQDAFVALKSAQCGPVAGRKIALTSPQMRAMVGLDTPIAGQLHARQVVGAAASVRASDYGRLIVEFEIGFRLGGSLAPRAKPYTREEVSAAVASAMPALEIADDRGADYATLPLRALELAADNAWNEGAVLGAPVTTWRTLDLAALHGVAWINGAVAGEGLGADAMGHPLNALQWIANHLSARGQTLHRGDIVICGSLVASKFPGAGDVLRFDTGPLGAVELQVT